VNVAKCSVVNIDYRALGDNPGQVAGYVGKYAGTASI
jgi:hypothetical protein